MQRIHYETGQFVGPVGLVFLREIESIADNTAGRKRRAAIFQCFCGKEFQTRIGDVTSGKAGSCGCTKGNEMKEYAEGDLINGVKFIRSLGTTNYMQRAIFECPECGRHWESSIGNIQAGHTKSCCDTIGQPKNVRHTISPAILYVARLYNETESFIKIGVCTRDPEKRLRDTPYQFEILKTKRGNNRWLFALEQRFLKMHKQQSYSPLLPFGGKTECFTIARYYDVL